MATKKVGSAGRFGARYGRRLRTQITVIERVQRQKQKCPYCSRQAVRRVATGIFLCSKCHAKFTGDAYKVHPIGGTGEQQWSNTNVSTVTKV